MDKFSIITQALKRLGEREYQQGSAVYDPVNIYFESVMRECNARHHWSFARRVRVPLKPWKPIHDKEHMPRLRDFLSENASEAPKNALERDVRNRIADERRKRHAGHSSGVFVIPDDCLRIMELTNSSGRKVRHWRLGVDVDRQKRIVYTDGEGDVFLTYTADILFTSESLPDFTPMYNNGVISLLAARLAPSVLGNEQMGQVLLAEAERYLQEAVLQDRRQERSNDQHPLLGIFERDILHDIAIVRQDVYL